MAMVARMDSLHDEVEKLTSEKRKRKRKDECLNFEKELEQEIEANLWANEGWIRQPQALVVDQTIAEPTPMILVRGKMVATTKPKSRVHTRKKALHLLYRRLPRIPVSQDSREWL